jgi:hypothetical protein
MWISGDVRWRPPKRRASSHLKLTSEARISRGRGISRNELSLGSRRCKSVKDGVNRVYVDLENIYPCVDIGVGDLAHDGSPIIVANVAGYSPKPFQKNWTGREGPFVFIIGQPYLDKLAGSHSPSNRAFRFITPDMKNLKRE